MVTGDLLVLSRPVLDYPAGYIFIFVSCELDRCMVIDLVGRIVYFWKKRLQHVLSR